VLKYREIKIKTNMKKGNGIFTVGILILVLFVVYAGYSFWQKSALEKELVQVDRELVVVQEKALQYQNQNVLEAITAKETAATLKANLIEWSKVIKEIRATVPKDKGDDLVNIISYSGSSNRDISLNVKTGDKSKEPYFDVADFIESFDDSKNFKGGFVPSVSSGKDDTGREILTFLFSTRFEEVEAPTSMPTSAKTIDEPTKTEATRNLR
jgi:hypothetical protein